MTITTFLNQKGGVGKTSCCHHLAGALALRGRRVLLVDNDPQASLTQGLLGPDAAEAIDPKETIAAVYEFEAMPPRVVRNTGIDGVDLVAGSWKLADWNCGVDGSTPGQRLALRTFLRGDLGGWGYDHVLIDCPPNLLLCAYAALVACDALFVPLQAEDYGAQGIAPVLGFASGVAAEHGPRPAGCHLLVTMFDKRPALPRLFLNELRAAYGTQLCDVVVPRSIDFPEAVMRRLPVSHHRPKGAAAAAVDLLADELERRVGFGGAAQACADAGKAVAR